MGNKFLVMFMLGMGLTFAQSVRVEVELDTLFTLVDKKDMEIKMAHKKVKKYKMMASEKDMELKKAMMKIDSLEYFKKYYMHSKHVIGPRVIRRIEEMVKHDGS